MIAPMGAQEWFTYTAKSVLDIFKDIRAELPKGEASEKALQHIEEAEMAFKKNEAVAAPPLFAWSYAARRRTQVTNGHEHERTDDEFSLPLKRV